MQLLLPLFELPCPDGAEKSLDAESDCHPGVGSNAPMIPETPELLSLYITAHQADVVIDALDILYAPLDVTQAHRLHGANCGPASFAALVGRNVCEVMRYFPNFSEKPVTNIPRMHAALRDSGLRFRRETKNFPVDGLVLIQVEGPWTAPRRAPYEAPRHRHWVSVRLDHVYEVNLESWVPRQVWEEDYLPALLSRHEGATGWSITTVFELELGRESEADEARSYQRCGVTHALSATSGKPRRKRR